MQNNRTGLLLILSGPSGVGKGVICKNLMQRNPKMHLSISATTRSPRPGEVEGVSYFYKSVPEFERMIENEEFLEYMRVFGTNYYGTPRAYVEEELSAGNDIILEIDVHGAKKVKKVCPEAVTVFIAPPSMSELKSRLIGRGTESVEAVEKRFHEAFEEMQCIPAYDYVVVNDVLDMAVTAVENIVSAERLKVVRRKDLIKELQGGLNEL